MVKLWQSYNQDLPPLTGQTTPIPMLLSQQHSAPTNAGSRSIGTLAQWRIGVNRPGDIICTGPKYQYAYVSDDTHLTNPDYERLGEKYGQVFTSASCCGNAWQPLQPTTVERSGRVITVHFHVPVPPLAWDTTLPLPHQSALHGMVAGPRLRGPRRQHAHRDQRRRDRGRQRADHLRDRPAGVGRGGRLRVRPPTGRSARTAPRAGASCAIRIRSSVR